MKKNSTSPFVRKIIYIAVIGGLLIPLSMISRPEVADADGQIVDGGGRLAQMRRKNINLPKRASLKLIQQARR